MVKALVRFVLATLCACDIPDVTFARPGDAGADAADAADAASPAPNVTARWTLGHRESGAPVGCPATASSTKILVNGWDPLTLGVDTSTREFTVGCTDGQAAIGLPPGVYVARMRIQDSSGANLNVSDLQHIDTQHGDVSVNFRFYDDAGFFSLAWTLLDHAGGSPISCAAAGISPQGWIELVSLPLGGGMFVDKLRCDDHIGSSQGFLPATYTFVVFGREAGTVVTTMLNAESRTLAVKSLVTLTDVRIPVQ